MYAAPCVGCVDCQRARGCPEEAQLLATATHRCLEAPERPCSQAARRKSVQYVSKVVSEHIDWALLSLFTIGNFQCSGSLFVTLESVNLFVCAPDGTYIQKSIPLSTKFHISGDTTLQFRRTKVLLWSVRKWNIKKDYEHDTNPKPAVDLAFRWIVTLILVGKIGNCPAGLKQHTST